MKMKLKDIGEIGLIEKLARRIKLDRSVVKGIGDDAAVIKWTSNKYLLYTCDMLIEDVHFRLDKATPYQIGWKALARNVSDIAAMGGVPRYALVSIGLDSAMPVSFIDELYRGMAELADKFGINIVGGDTAKSKSLVIDVSLIGEVEKKNLILRSGAKAGDLIVVTGYIGGAAKGKHLNFMPRIMEVRSLVKDFKINSMIDISDGLVLDLWRILDASGVGGYIYKGLVPVSNQAASFEKAISEGEDFELVFTMSPKEVNRAFMGRILKIRTPVTLIGEVVNKRCGYKLVMDNGKKKDLKVRGYLHF